jgi:hypothetical protein
VEDVTRWLVAASVALLAGSVECVARQGGSPFDVLSPSVSISATDRARLEAGATLVRVLPETDGRVAIFGARRVSADGDRLVVWIREIAQFKAGKFVDSIGRFHEPPAPEDVARLSLDDRELETLRDCRPGRCGTKLTAREVASLRDVVESAGEGGNRGCKTPSAGSSSIARGPTARAVNRRWGRTSMAVPPSRPTWCSGRSSNGRPG